MTDKHTNNAARRMAEPRLVAVGFDSHTVKQGLYLKLSLTLRYRRKLE